MKYTIDVQPIPMTHTIAVALEKLRVTRRVGYFFTLWVTYYSIQHCFDYAHAALEAGISSGEVAGVIAAIMVPVSGLQGAVISFYHKDRPHAVSTQ